MKDRNVWEERVSRDSRGLSKRVVNEEGKEKS